MARTHMKKPELKDYKLSKMLGKKVIIKPSRTSWPSEQEVKERADAMSHARLARTGYLNRPDATVIAGSRFPKDEK